MPLRLRSKSYQLNVNLTTQYLKSQCEVSGSELLFVEKLMRTDLKYLMVITFSPADC